MNHLYRLGCKLIAYGMAFIGVDLNESANHAKNYPLAFLGAFIVLMSAEIYHKLMRAREVSGGEVK